jgi:hypothetical protein
MWERKREERGTTLGDSSSDTKGEEGEVLAGSVLEGPKGQDLYSPPACALCERCGAAIRDGAGWGLWATTGGRRNSARRRGAIVTIHR